jgi:hypothetical protein
VPPPVPTRSRASAAAASAANRPFLYFSVRAQRAKGPLAQLVEQETLNLKVAGSIPARPIHSPSFSQSEEEKRRDAFKDDLRTSLEAQQVSDELTDCLIDVVDKTLTDEMIALVPPNVGGAQLAAIVAQSAPQLSATCPAAAQAFSSTG